jgi:hypothetical protein
MPQLKAVSPAQCAGRSVSASAARRQPALNHVAVRIGHLAINADAPA